MAFDGFHIDKWYLDFVSEDNEVWIFYAARIEWRGLSVPYTAFIYGSPGKESKSSSRYYQVHFPKVEEECISWQDSRFHIQGRWSPLAGPIYQRLYEHDGNFLDWHCHMPAADVSIRTGDREVTGKGYVEQLKITIPPWKIPIDQLRWGRFISGNESLVWVDFKNGAQNCWVWYNGQEITGCAISDNILRIGNLNKSLDMKHVADIENEQSINKVVQNLVRYLPGFNRILPLNFLFAQNHKWLSNGSILSEGEEVSTGNVIHELVEFKNPS